MCHWGNTNLVLSRNTYCNVSCTVLEFLKACKIWTFGYSYSSLRKLYIDGGDQYALVNSNLVSTIIITNDKTVKNKRGNIQGAKSIGFNST